MKSFLALVLLLCLITSPSWAQYQIPSSVIAGGGSEMSGGNTIRGTVGQFVVGRAVGGSYQLNVGFWHEYKEFVSAADEVPGYIWALQSAYPNPFNPQTTITYSLPDQSFINLSIYDIRGSLVATLVDESVEAGDHSAVWLGKTDSGFGVSSGVYFARIDSKHGVLTQKMVLTR